MVEDFQHKLYGCNMSMSNCLKRTSKLQGYSPRTAGICTFQECPCYSYYGTLPSLIALMPINTVSFIYACLEGLIVARLQ